MWLLGQAVKTSPFHGGNTGSIPVGVIRFELITAGRAAKVKDTKRSRLRNNQKKLKDLICRCGSF